MPQIRHVSSRPQGQLTADIQSAAQGRHSPLHNRLLAPLPTTDVARLRPLMKSVSLLRGTLVYGGEEERDQRCFPTAGIFAHRFDTTSGATTGLAVTGSEDALGIVSILGGDSAPTATLRSIHRSTRHASPSPR